MQGKTDVAYCQAASEPVAYRLVFNVVKPQYSDTLLTSITVSSRTGLCDIHHYTSGTISTVQPKTHKQIDDSFHVTPSNLFLRSP